MERHTPGTEGISPQSVVSVVNGYVINECGSNLDRAGVFCTDDIQPLNWDPGETGHLHPRSGCRTGGMPGNVRIGYGDGYGRCCVVDIGVPLQYHVLFPPIPVGHVD